MIISTSLIRITVMVFIKIVMERDIYIYGFICIVWILGCGRALKNGGCALKNVQL